MVLLPNDGCMDLHGVAKMIATKSPESDWYLLDTATVQLVGELGQISYSYVIQTEKWMKVHTGEMKYQQYGEIPVFLKWDYFSE